MICWSRLEALASVKTHRELINTLHAYSKDAGFDNFGIAMQIKRQELANACIVTDHNYGNEFANLYFALDDPEIARKDPRVLMSLNKMEGAAWDSNGWIGNPFKNLECPDRSPKIQDSASNTNLTCGITIPISLENIDWGFVTFSSCQKINPKELVARKNDATQFIHYYSLVLEKISTIQHQRTAITNRELEVLKWAAIGKTSWEIASIMSISERTANFHLSNTARKLGVVGRRAACSLAISKGLISIGFDRVLP